jgi:hypothetical protein
MGSNGGSAMNESSRDASSLVRRALLTEDEAYLEAEQALWDHDDPAAITSALDGQDDPAAPLLAELVARRPARGASGAGAAEVDRHLARLERYFEKKVPGSPPARATVDALSARFGAGASELLALRLLKRSGPPDWRTSVALGFLQRHPTPAAVAALLRFAAESPVAWQRDLAVAAIRAAADPALASKVAAERARLVAAGRRVPPELANLA